MARPFLADADFAAKVATGNSEHINTCIACNQACLDNIFVGRIASCLVNPRACRETELVIEPAPRIKHIAVVGAGPGGLAAATTLAQRGHRVSLYEAENRLGGQFNMAKVIPGKQDYGETIRYYSNMLQQYDVSVNLNRRVSAAGLLAGGYEEVILATGVTPRIPDIPGIDHPMVLSYVDVLWHRQAVGRRVAIVGAGGIGFDTAEFLSYADSGEIAVDDFLHEWGIDNQLSSAGGLAQQGPQMQSARAIYLCQRSSGRFGSTLGKSTGWAIRAALQLKGVQTIGGVLYRHIDDGGLHIEVDGSLKTLAVDNVVICAGQESQRELLAELQAGGMQVHLIGGAERAAELDAQRAIEQAVRLAGKI
jgi:2,4-dienoyl-CoA reductase (NADPH2)